MCDCDRCKALRDSNAFVIACVQGSVDSIDQTLLGLAIIKSKPILMVTPVGFEVPEKLAKVVDRFIEYDPDPKKVVASIHAALVEMGIVKPGQEVVEKYRDDIDDSYGPKPSIN
jgi:hypothetical protein